MILLKANYRILTVSKMAKMALKWPLLPKMALKDFQTPSISIYLAGVIGLRLLL